MEVVVPVVVVAVARSDRAARGMTKLVDGSEMHVVTRALLAQ